MELVLLTIILGYLAFRVYKFLTRPIDLSVAPRLMVQMFQDVNWMLEQTSPPRRTTPHLRDITPREERPHLSRDELERRHPEAAARFRAAEENLRQARLEKQRTLKRLDRP